MRRGRYRPPFDFRVTRRCLLQDLNVRTLDRTSSFAALAAENAFIDVFRVRATAHPHGGADAIRVPQVKGREVYAFRGGRYVYATWFDSAHGRPEIVWLLAVREAEEGSDATSAGEILAALEQSSELFPAGIDYLRLELDRRKLDTADFAERARADARDLVGGAAKQLSSDGEVAGIRVRLAWVGHDAYVALYVAVGTEPIVGERSRAEFALTSERFLLVIESVRQAAEHVYGELVLARPIDQWPRTLKELESECSIYLLVFEVPMR